MVALFSSIQPHLELESPVRMRWPFVCQLWSYPPTHPFTKWHLDRLVYFSPNCECRIWVYKVMQFCTICAINSMPMLQVLTLGQDIAHLLVATSTADYISKAVAAAHNENLRHQICNRKELLFGRDSLTATADEWSTLFHYLHKSVQ